MESLKILLLEDDVDDAEFVQHFLKRSGIKFNSTLASSKEEYVEALNNTEFDIILSDHSLPQFNSKEALEIRNEKELVTPFIIVSGTIPEEFAVSIVQDGASDYILKDRLQRLPTAIYEAINKRKLADEKIRTERSLYESNERFQLAAKATADAIWDWDLNTNKMFLGEGFETLFGYRSEENTNALIFWLRDIHPHDKERVTKSLIDVINSSDNTNWKEEYRYIKHNGLFATVINKGIILRDENEKPIRMVGAIQDITEQTEKTNELKQFSFIISHNLNAPLSNLIAIFNLLNYKSIDANNLALIEMLGRSTKQIKQVIDHLTHILIIKNTSVDIKELEVKDSIIRAQAMLQHEIKELNPEISLDLKKGVIKSNASYLDSIFLNLLSNSLKFRCPKRKLKIIVSSEPFINSRTKIVFSDNGLGIDMVRNRNKVFGMYQRFHEKCEGNGLGLFLIKSHITALGGSIDVQSKVGEGTSFYITL